MAAYKQRLAANAGARRRAGTWACIGGYFSQDSLLVRVATDSGVGLLLGGDGFAGNGDLPDFVQAAGLTPYQALATGTKNFGQYLRTLDPHGDETGTIAVGQRADLVLLTGNPLADIRQVPNRLGANSTGQKSAASTTPALVMVGGRWLARPELDRRAAAVQFYLSSRVWTSQLWQNVRTDLSLTAEVRAAVARLDARYHVPHRAWAERFVLTKTVPAGGADSGRGPQQLVDIFARQFGELRAVLPTAAQARFDERARAWIRELERAGYRMTIPGVRP